MRRQSDEALAFYAKDAERVAVNGNVPRHGEYVPTPEHYRILPPREHWALRFSAFVLVAISKPNLYAATVALLTLVPHLLLRGIGTSWKPGPLRVWLGGRVSQDELEERYNECVGCSLAYTRFDGENFGPLFCGGCGCGEHKLASLTGGWFAKNRFAKWLCPRGSAKHKSTKYPKDKWYESIPEADRGFVQLNVSADGRNSGQRTTGCGAKG